MIVKAYIDSDIVQATRRKFALRCKNEVMIDSVRNHLNVLQALEERFEEQSVTLRITRESVGDIQVRSIH